MRSYRVSVLVPICNVEKYLRRCLDSLEWQTLEDIQIICIDDGSSDSSPDIVAEYCKRDDRFELISKPNSGYGDSMNQGLSHARGEYIGIVESDDFAEPEMFEELYQAATLNDVDIVKTNFFEYFIKDGRELNIFVDNLCHCEYDKVFCPLEEQNIFLTQPAIWSALYKRSFLEKNNLRFLPTPGASFQDTSFNFKVFAAAERVILMPDAYLHYRTDNTTSSVKSQSKIFPICDEYQEIWQFAQANQTRWESLSHTIPHIQYGGYLWNLKRLSPEIQYAFYEKFVSTFTEINDAGLLDLDRFDPDVQEDIQHMLANPDAYFEQTFGPVSVDCTYIISAQAGFADKLENIAQQIGTYADKNAEIICITNVEDEASKRVVETLRDKDKRFFSRDIFYENPWCERIDPTRLRGARVVVCNAGFYPCDNQTYGPDAHLFLLNKVGAFIQNNETEVAFYYDMSDHISIAFYDKEALCALDVPILTPLLLTTFYARKLKGIVDGTPLAYTQVDAKRELCPRKDYEDAADVLIRLIDWNKKVLEENDNSYQARKIAYRQLAGIWSHVRALHSGLAYADRKLIGEALHAPDDSILIFPQTTSEQKGKSIDISVIIPVYNMEQYIAECLQSVLSQKNCTMQIICINDGSTDASMDILEEIASNNTNVMLATQFNEGVAVARNRGLDFAKGEYFAFIDPDDYYACDDALISLIIAARNNMSLVCGGSFSAVDSDNGDIQNIFHGDENLYVFQEEGYRSFADDQYDYGWIRFIYHCSLFFHSDTRFPLLSHYEDPVFFLHIAVKAGGYYAIPKMVYRYRTNHKETTWKPSRVVDMLKGIAINLEVARIHDYNRLYSLLVRRLEADYYQPIMDNKGDCEVLENLADIQAKIDPKRITWVRDFRELSYVIRPLRDMGAIPLPPPEPEPEQEPESEPKPLVEFSENVAIVRAAQKLGRSAPYRLAQRTIWRIKDVGRKS